MFAYVISLKLGVMFRFIISQKRVEIDPVSLMVKEFNDFYYSNDPGHASDVFSYIHLASQIDMSAPLFGARTDEAKQLAARYIWGIDYENIVNYEDFDGLLDVYFETHDTPEVRVYRAFNRKIDQIQDMLDTTEPKIEKSINQKTGTFTIVSNGGVITKMMKELKTILNDRDELEQRMRGEKKKEASIVTGKRKIRRGYP